MSTSILTTRPFLWDSPFTRLERVLLICILVSCLFPYPFKIGNMLEITTAFFVFLSPAIILILKRNLHFLVILGFPLIIGQILGTGGLAEKTTILVYMKFCIYMCFIGILALRCWNPINRRFLIMWIIIPLATIVCISVWLDLYTNTLFFAKYQGLLLGSDAMEYFLESYGTPDISTILEYRNFGSGLAQRPWHVAPWVMCALIGLMTLRNHGDFKSGAFWPLFIFLFITPLLLPHRNAIFMIGTGTVGYFLLTWGRMEEKKWLALLISALIMIIIFAGSQLFLYTLTSARSEENLTALLKLTKPSDFSFSDIFARYEMFIGDAEWLVRNPIFLFFGTGYNIVLTPSIKPHNLYIATVTASGLFGLFTLLAFIKNQLKNQVGSKGVWRRTSAITKSGLLSLCFAGMVDSYLTSRLGVPAFFMTLWLVVCVIAARQPYSGLSNRATPIRNIMRTKIQYDSQLTRAWAHGYEQGRSGSYNAKT